MSSVLKFTAIFFAWTSVIQLAEAVARLDISRSAVHFLASIFSFAVMVAVMEKFNG